jgi:hypothetical protein
MTHEIEHNSNMNKIKIWRMPRIDMIEPSLQQPHFPPSPNIIANWSAILMQLISPY